MSKSKKNGQHCRAPSAALPNRWNPSRLRPPEADTSTLPVLRFTPTAWAKLHFFCHRGDTEIGGFAITAPDDLLLVEEFVTVKQTATAVSIAFEDGAVADLFDAQVDAGRKPEQFARVWLHTHPGESPEPSAVDEEAFARVFGGCDWAVLFVLARGGKTYARLRFNVGPGGELLIPVRIDYSTQFGGADHGAWVQEYEKNIHATRWTSADPGLGDWDTYLDDCIERGLLTEAEREQISSEDEEVIFECEQPF